MTRYFLALAVLNVGTWIAAIVSGSISLAKVSDPTHEQAYLIHFILGLIAVFNTLLIHCLVMTYFLGTGRLVKEACVAYGLPDTDLPKRTRDLKRRNTPGAILGMLLAISAAAAGMGSRTEVWPWYIHLVLVVATVVVNLRVFVIEHQNLSTNLIILDELFHQVESIRAERGLPPSEEVFESGA
jgi:hypothetical protein